MLFAWKKSSLVPDENGVLVRQAIKIGKDEKCPEGYTTDPFVKTEIKFNKTEHIDNNASEIEVEKNISGFEIDESEKEHIDDNNADETNTELPKRRGRPPKSDK